MGGGGAEVNSHRKEETSDDGEKTRRGSHGTGRKLLHFHVTKMFIEFYKITVLAEVRKN